MIVISGYNVIEELSDTHVFKWIRAEDLSGNKVILQIPNPEASWNTEPIQVLKDYFQALQNIAGLDHMFPNQVLSDPDYKLIIQYPDKPCETLVAALARTPENAERLWRRVCDSLFRLHNRGLEHGHVSLDSFVVVKDSVYLTRFGYAPLLKMGHAGALADVGSGPAPEVKGSQHEVTKKSDIYALAKAVAAWKPDFEQTDIYNQATRDSSQDRIETARDLQSKLTLYLRPRMFNVSATADPRTAGTVIGGGEYKDGTTIRIEAKPGDGWRFSHWTVDLGGHENPVAVKVDRNKRIVAEFVKLPVILRVDIKPRNAGIAYVEESSLDDRNTGIEFERGRTVKVEVQPISDKWKFIGWQGDASGSNASVDVTMDANKVVVANFEKVRKKKKDTAPPPAPVPIYELDVKVKPHGAGSISGAGRYQDGTNGKHSEAIIEAKPKKGYRFDHWEGDVPANAKTTNPLAMTMDGNKVLVAHFTKVITTIRIRADVEPPRAGSVKGVGEYAKGSGVKLTALPASTEITFGKWGGDLNGSNNPIRIRAIRDVHVKAYFLGPKEMAIIRKKVRLMIVGSPVTICPFLVFMTGLMAMWALGIPIISGLAPFLCLSGLLVNGGILFTRLIFGSERFSKQAWTECEEEKRKLDSTRTT